MFRNPLLPRGADPWAIHHDGFYYYTHSTFSGIKLWKTSDLTELCNARPRVVWRPTPGAANSKNIWAPEIHRLDGKWYIYFAADDGENRNHRMYVLENSSADPMRGVWEPKGELRTPGDRWAIDGTVVRVAGRLHLLWSGWEGCDNGRQNIYIAGMRDPWTLGSDRVCISTPEHAWERHGRIARPGPDDKPHVEVNEGPAALIRNGRIFVTYSASGSWTDFYSVGLLWADAENDLLCASSWRKSPHPVFTAVGTASEGTWATGHNSFFRSPDGTEDWILFHANRRSGQHWRSRAPRAQKFTWSDDGFPCFGEPAGVDTWMARPSDRRGVDLPSHASDAPAAEAGFIVPPPSPLPHTPSLHRS